MVNSYAVLFAALIVSVPLLARSNEKKIIVAIFAFAILVQVVIIPLIEYSLGVVYKPDILIDPFDYYPYAWLLCLLGFISFAIGSLIEIPNSCLLAKSKKIQIVPDFKRSIILLAIVFIFLLMYNQFQIENFIFRGGGTVDRLKISKNIWIFINFFVLFCPWMILLLNLTAFQGSLDQRKKIQILIVCILGLLIVPITVLPRIHAGVFFGSAVLVLLYKLNRLKLIYIISLIVAAIISAPILNWFRHFGVGITFNLLNGDFDSFQNLSLLLATELRGGVDHVVGSLFFWVPRSFWVDKPVGVGTLLAQHLDLGNSNIAVNFFGELFYSLDALGICCISLVIGFFFRNLEMFLHRWFIEAYAILICSLIGLWTFFLVRGDLLNSLFFLACVGFVFCTVLFLTCSLKWIDES